MRSSSESGGLGGRVAVITGAADRLGHAISIALARAGARVVPAHAPERPTERERVQQLAAAIGAPLVAELDVSDRASVRAAFGAVAERLGRIDVLVNNAEHDVPVGFENVREEDWDRVIAVTLKGVFLCCQEALPYLPPGARIVNIGSYRGREGDPDSPAYAAAKAGVSALTHCLARFVGSRGITVNCVAAGPLEAERRQAEAAASRPLNASGGILARPVRPAEVAATVVYLASPGASYVTAQTIPVDGGIVP